MRSSKESRTARGKRQEKKFFLQKKVSHHEGKFCIIHFHKVSHREGTGTARKVNPTDKGGEGLALRGDWHRQGNRQGKIFNDDDDDRTKQRKKETVEEPRAECEASSLMRVREKAGVSLLPGKLKFSSSFLFS